MASNKFWESLYAIDRRILYAILIVLCSWQVLKPITVPNVPLKMSQAMFDFVDKLNEGDVIVIESDWTTSTRGESNGQFKALMRHLMRKRVKFIVTSIDPLAPKIAKIAIEEVIKEEPIDSYKYKQGIDYAIAGYFPNAENHVVGMVNNITRELAPKGIPSMPVFANIKDLSDCKAVILATASSSINVWYERIRNKAPIGLMCTAVMAGENIPYFASNQLFGMIIGAKGAFDYETLLQQKYPDKKYTNYQTGQRYMSPLFFALTVLILSVIVGNIAMVVLRKRGGQS